MNQSQEILRGFGWSKVDPQLDDDVHRVGEAIKPTDVRKVVNQLMTAATRVDVAVNRATSDGLSVPKTMGKNAEDTLKAANRLLNDVGRLQV